MNIDSFDLLEAAVYGLVIAAALKLISTAVLYRSLSRAGVIDDWVKDQLRAAKRRKPENRSLAQKYLMWRNKK